MNRVSSLTVTYVRKQKNKLFTAGWLQLGSRDIYNTNLDRWYMANKEFNPWDEFPPSSKLRADLPRQRSAFPWRSPRPTSWGASPSNGLRGRSLRQRWMLFGFLAVRTLGFVLVLFTPRVRPAIPETVPWDFSGDSHYSESRVRMKVLDRIR